MVLKAANICAFGWKAQYFALKGVDGKTYSLDDVRGPKGTLVVFIVITALMSRHPLTVSLRKPKRCVRLASAQSPSCQTIPRPTAKIPSTSTPDFFGFNAQDELQYRGRLDPSRLQPTPNARRDLFEAMTKVAETGRGPEEQVASMGCSIKWKR